MLTLDDFQAAGIPLQGDGQTVLLQANAAAEWLAANTTLSLDPLDAASLQALPSTAKLFIAQFCALVNKPIGVTSESIEGLSQSFSSGDRSNDIWVLADSLLSDWIPSQVGIFPAKQRWR